MKVTILGVAVAILLITSCAPSEKKLDPAQETAFYYLGLPIKLAEERK